MLLRVIGVLANFLGVFSCIMIARFSFKLWHLGERKALYLLGGAIFISFGLSFHGFVFLLQLSRKLLFPPASLFLLIGYFCLVGSYTAQSFRNPLHFLALPLPYLLFGGIEFVGTLLILYLLFLVAYNTGKLGGHASPFTVATFLLLFVTQLMITWGFYIFSPIFLWGVACRGFSFVPMLLVAFDVRRR